MFAWVQKVTIVKVILKEGGAFIWAHRHLIKNKVIIVPPIDVTSHMYGLPKWGAAR